MTGFWAAAGLNRDSFADRVSVQGILSEAKDLAHASAKILRGVQNDCVARKASCV